MYLEKKIWRELRRVQRGVERKMLAIPWRQETSIIMSWEQLNVKAILMMIKNKK